jgi:putative membrane protein
MRQVMIVALLATCVAIAVGPATAGRSMSGVSSQDRAFVQTAGHANAAEIQGARAALQKSTNPLTLAFARRMIKDHTALGAKLKLVAAKNGLAAPSTPSAAQMAQLKTLGTLSGQAFDQSYSKEQVAAHVAAVTLFTTESTQGHSVSLRAAASAALPTLKMHLTMAHTLEASVVSKAAPAR